MIILKEKNNNIFVVIIVILSILLIISIGYTIYDKIESSKTQDEEIKMLTQQEAQELFEKIVKDPIIEFAFPTKTYGDISFPSGFYDALKIEIGKAKGQNWWCVMFPPLCFVDVTSGIVPEESKDTIKENLSQEEYDLLSKNNEAINFKFKIVETFQNISIKLAQS